MHTLNSLDAAHAPCAPLACCACHFTCSSAELVTAHSVPTLSWDELYTSDPLKQHGADIAACWAMHDWCLIRGNAAMASIVSVCSNTCLMIMTC